MSQTETRLNLRAEIDRYLESGSAPLAFARISELWRRQRDVATAAFVCSSYEKLRGQLPLLDHRTAILRSFTVEPILPLLRAEAFTSGIDLTLHVGDFNAYSQEILDSASTLYQAHPDSVILAVRTPDVAPELWSRFADLSREEVAQAQQRVSSTFRQLIEGFRKHSQAAMIVHNLEEPVFPHSGLLDAQSPNGQSEVLRQINRDLVQHAGASRGVYVLDYDGLQARHGRKHWQDDRKYLMARLPVSGVNLIHVAQEWLRFLAPISGKVAKAVVVDLDNTLWGGVIGEDGMTGIKLGPDYPGAAYQALQRALLDLTRRRILLAICSKNNPEDAMEALEKHPGMVLRPADFAAMRISWNEKVLGLREIASELNIGIDSLAFLDDNPVEREAVRASLPEVTVIDLPEDPFDYASVVQQCPVLQRLSISTEDQMRTAFYAGQREREHSEQLFQSKEDFFRYLEQKVEIAPVSPETLARVAQLTQKTNQFNLTTQRYNEQQIMDLSSRGWQVLSIRVHDRFGDQGLVGVSIAHDEHSHDEQAICEIDTFLLSCRVIGRTVETALLSVLTDIARKRGNNRVKGCFLPTKKNAPARNFYSEHGFTLESENGTGSWWTFDLRTQEIPCPAWIELKLIELKIMDGAQL